MTRRRICGAFFPDFCPRRDGFRVYENENSQSEHKGGDGVEDEQALRKLRRGDQKALEALVVRYTPYVSAVIRNQLGGLSAEEDVEEIGRAHV